MKIIKPRNTPKNLPPQIGDSLIESWEYCQNMSIKNPTQLGIFINPLKHDENSRIRNLDSRLDGDWYYILQSLFGNYVSKIKPGKIRLRSNINDKIIDKNYSLLAHIKCGISETSSFGVRISTCLYNGGRELQIPIEEINKIESSEYYFFEKDGLFLLLNMKKVEKLNNLQKWLAIGNPTEDSSKRFQNYSFNTLYLLKFGCIEQYGFCDGTNIFKNNFVTELLRKDPITGKRRTKYSSFPKKWLRGCQSSFGEAKYQLFYITSNEYYEIIDSLTVSDLIKNLTTKKGEKLSRQTASHQAKVNTNNFLENKIGQKLSICYWNNKEYLIFRAGYDEDQIKKYVRDISLNIENRKIIKGLTTFLMKESIKTNKRISTDNMTIDNFYDFISKNNNAVSGIYEMKLEEYKSSVEYSFRSDINSHYYPNDKAYFANRKRNFITKKEIEKIKINILSGENELEKDYFEIIFYKSLDKNKIFSNLKRRYNKDGP